MCETLPRRALVGGRDIDGATIYVGRANHNGHVLPAKVIPDRRRAYICEIKIKT